MQLSESPDLICLSHLRWDFVYQRPQHLMSRFARDRRVFFVEEPVWGDGPKRLEVSERPGGVRVAVPHLPHGLSAEEAEAAQAELLSGLLAEQGVSDYVLWYYTPMAIPFSEHLSPRAVVYDCMDELSLFRGAPGKALAVEAPLPGSQGSKHEGVSVRSPHGVAVAHDRDRIREVEHRHLVPLRDHVEPTMPPAGRHVLLEGIEIADAADLDAEIPS